MSKVIDNALNSIDGYLLTINKNTLKNWYEIDIGIPNNWVLQEDTKVITCEEIAKNNEGKLIRIKPKTDSIVIDDLVNFIGMIIHTNKKILEKENEFNDEMQRYKSELEEKTRKFYDELDKLKKSSFNDLIDNFDKSIDSTKTTSIRSKTPQKRGRKKKIESTTTDNGNESKEMDNDDKQ